VPRSVSAIDWSSWKPDEFGTLCFVLEREEKGEESRILLIRKKRGLGAGKLVGPGGRLEPGETAYGCAIREVQEELCITPLGVVARGEHDFQFTDGYAIRVFAFTATGFEGVPSETDEAIPAWQPLSDIPYSEMWEDNRVWLPLMLDEIPFSGRYVFDGDTMLDHEIEHRFDAERAHRLPR
jgi:8-oxo-dGTP diphosphatase